MTEGIEKEVDPIEKRFGCVGKKYVEIIRSEYARLIKITSPEMLRAPCMLYMERCRSADVKSALAESKVAAKDSVSTFSDDPTVEGPSEMSRDTGKRDDASYSRRKKGDGIKVELRCGKYVFTIGSGCICKTDIPERLRRFVDDVEMAYSKYFL